MVSGVKIILPIQRIGTILQCASDGKELDDIEVNIQKHDAISYQFLTDDPVTLKAKYLHPKARIMHRVLTHSLLPRTCSCEMIHKHNYQCLYALWGGKIVNLLKIIMYEIRLFHQ